MSKIVLFTGGARSGKSACAERYAARLSQRVAYIATAEAGDDEMRARIAQHRRRRPASWTTLEAPAAVAAALAELDTRTVALLDCLSLLVSNVLLATARGRDLILVIVTNEVGMGIVPAYPLGREYRDVLGRANQQVAAAADEVYLLVCGIPVELRALEVAWA